MHFRNALQSFFWGIITAGIALIFQLIFISIFSFFIDFKDFNKNIFDSFAFLIFYALSEESFKYFITSKKIISLSYGRGFLINAWIAGVGFSLFEAFIIYQKNILEKINFETLSLFETAPLHILTFGLLGYSLGLWYKKTINFKIIFFIFIFHFLYNYSIIFWEPYSRHITSAIIFILLIINLYAFAVVNKKLASD